MKKFLLNAFRSGGLASFCLFKWVAFLYVSCLFCSCTVEKRHYLKGYYIEYQLNRAHHSRGETRCITCEPALPEGKTPDDLFCCTPEPLPVSPSATLLIREHAINKPGVIDKFDAKKNTLIAGNSRQDTLKRKSYLRQGNDKERKVCNWLSASDFLFGLVLLFLVVGGLIEIAIIAWGESAFLTGLYGWSAITFLLSYAAYYYARQVSLVAGGDQLISKVCRWYSDYKGTVNDGTLDQYKKSRKIILLFSASLFLYVLVFGTHVLPLVIFCIIALLLLVLVGMDRSGKA